MPSYTYFGAFRGSSGGLTIEEQKDLMQRAQEEVGAAEPKVEADSAASALPAAVRIMPLGEDRRGALYWKLQCSSILAGDAVPESSCVWCLTNQFSLCVYHFSVFGPAYPCSARDLRGYLRQ